MPTALLILASLLVLTAGLLTGRNIRELSQAKAPVAAHFPGLPKASVTTKTVRPRHWYAAGGIAIVVVVGLAIWNVSAVATLIVALIAAVALAAMAWPIHQRARACVKTNAAIAAYAPTIAMPYAGKMLVHVGMWAPWIDRAKVHWCVVARTPDLLAELAAKYDIPMLAGEIPDSVKAALYPHGSAKNASFLATEGVRHVFLGHGDSDKPLSASERVLDYDVVTVAGQAAVDRFKAAGLQISPDRIRVIGRPQTEGIDRARGPMSSIASPTVLYAPTWRHADDSVNLSSLIVGDTIVQALIDRGVTVVFRRHFAGRNHVEAEAMIERIYGMLEDDAAATGREHIWGEAASAELPLVDAFNLSDAMISDVSGIVVDFMQSEKPFAMYASQVTSSPELATVFRTAHPTAESAYVIDRDLFNLDTILRLMLGPDPLSPSRADRAAFYLGGRDREDPASQFVRFVEELGA